MPIPAARAFPPPPPLPEGLPPPRDDGGAAHLRGADVPHVELVSTDGRPIDLAELAASSLILFVYPMIGRPDRPLPPGWDEVPGARGCTQQSCAFRDLYARFADLGYVVAGLSTQSPPDQREAVARLHLNFPLLADPDLRLRDALVLPTFEVAGATYYRRLTLIARERRIVKVFYPIFPPQENAPNVLAWIGTHS